MKEKQCRCCEIIHGIIENKVCYHGHLVGDNCPLISKGDGILLFSAKHKFWPGKKWYEKVWLYFRYSFVKPKLSDDAVEIIKYYDKK